MGDTGSARTEAQVAQVAYRKRVRSASLAIVFGLAGVLAVSAVLPTTQAVDRAALLLTSALVVVAGLIWFLVLPRGLFGEGRVFVACCVALGVMTIMLGLTGGPQSVYFPYYLMPILVMVLSGSWRGAAVLGALSATGVMALAFSVPSSDVVRDLTVTRLFQVATFTFFAAATALATGETRRMLAERTAMLATQRDDAFHMAITDELTGLYNRHYMRDVLQRMTARAARHDTPFAILSLDVDGLKALNDSRGHQAGDALLRGIADALRAVLRSEDIAVRTGGDEFIVLLPDADRGEAVKVAYRVRQRVTALGDHGAGGISSGVAVWRRGSDPDEALRQADDELYRAKASRAAQSG